MDVAAQSRERVGERIQRLEETYGSFPVNQRTLSVPESGYERALDRCEDGLADVYVEARNGDGEVLLVRSQNTWEIPCGRTTDGESLEHGARRELQRVADVECTIDGIHQVTILGVSSDDGDRPPVYRLLVVFVASCERFDDPDSETVEWHSEVPEQARP
jgi:ADP-ribose pyrophosphatase YjhB (NUDIX family)